MTVEERLVATRVADGTAARRTRRTTAQRLSLVSLAAMTAAAVCGLALHGGYPHPESAAAMFRAYDVVTLLLAAPMLGWALWRVRRGSVVAELVWIAMLAYVVYTYALYVFGMPFGRLFLLHIVAFTSAVFALALGLSTVFADGLPATSSRRVPVRVIAGVLATLAVSLGAMWVVAAVRFAVSGDVPAGSALVESDAIVHTGIALDLVLLVPAYAISAVLLWRRSGWGYVTAALVLVSGSLHQVGYLLAMPFQVAADVSGASAFDPAEPVVALAFIVPAIVLLRGCRAARDA